MARFIAFVQTKVSSSLCEVPFEIDDEELEGLTDDEREELISGDAQDAISNSYEWGWREDGE
jgi:hypothetical protein